MKPHDAGDEVHTHLTDADLGAYHDGVLSDDEVTHTRVTRHLERCLLCQRRLELLREDTTDAARPLPQAASPRRHRAVPEYALAAGLVLSLGLNLLLGSWVQEAWHGSPPENLLTTRGAAEEGDPARGDDAQVLVILRQVAERQYQMGQYSQVIEIATAMLLLNPQEVQAYRYRGLAEKALGDWEQAAQDLQQAARLGDSEAQGLLAAP